MIVVTGATGNVGRPLVEMLAAAGERVTALARRPVGGLPPGVTFHAADLADARSVRPLLDGAEALFLLVAGEDPQGVLDAAKAAGVGRVVLLSSQGAATRPGMYPHPRAFEDAVTGSALAWTVLRPGGFASNAYAWAQSVRTQRTVFAPFGDVGLPTIDPADIAEVAAVALRGDGHTGRVYELTGPALSTPRQRTQVIADALGAPIRFVELTRDQARAEMLKAMPEPVVDGTLAILGQPTPAEQRISPDVAQVLGRAPRTFQDWLHRNVPAFQ
jgi:uncharacterized protein YbjT (DUF2867 family)